MATPANVNRLSDADRVGTSVSVSQNGFADANTAGAAQATAGSRRRAGAAILVTAADFADALVGTPLAARVQAPVLLTASGELDARVAAELRRILSAGQTVYILGGSRAVSDRAASQVAALGLQVVRVAGADRYATSLAVATRPDLLGDPSTLVLANGLDFPDALTAGAAAARLSGAVLLTAGRGLPPAVASHLVARPAAQKFAVGGAAAAAVPSAAGIVGVDRYETAALVASRFFSGVTVAGISSGLSYADAASGSAHVAISRGPLLLTRPDALPAATESWLRSQATVTQVWVYGGVGAVTDGVRQQAQSAIAR